MNEAVEQRQHRRTGSDPGADRIDRGIEVVVLGGQQDQIIRAADAIGRRDLDRHLKIAERTVDLEPLFGERRGARGTHQKRHVAARLGQPPAEIPADRAGPEHQNAHSRAPQRAAAVRPLTRARPRSTSTASLSCSSLVVPMSPEATEGCSFFAG